MSNGHLQYYINGSLAGSTTVNTAAASQTPTQLSLGDEYWWFQTNYTIDDLAIWNKALTPIQVSQLYSNSLQEFPSASAPEPSQIASSILLIVAFGGYFCYRKTVKVLK
jgi:hypothetical protein